MIASVSLAGYWVDTSKFYDFMFINVCQGCFCFSSDFLFLTSLAYLCKVLHVQIAFIYMYHTFSEPQYGGPCTQGKSLTRTVTSGSEKDQFYVRWRPIQHTA